MYFAMNRFQTQSDREQDFETAWRERESYLSEVPGFLEFWLLRGAEGEYISCSHWADEAAFRAWTGSEAFRKAHGQRRMPQGVLEGHPHFSGYEIVLHETP